MDKKTENGFEIIENESLSKYSYIKTGGNAKKIVFPLTEEGFIEAIKTFENAYVFGNCSNVIFPDEGVDKTIILTTKMKKISVLSKEDAKSLLKAEINDSEFSGNDTSSKVSERLENDRNSINPERLKNVTNLNNSGHLENETNLNNPERLENETNLNNSERLKNETNLNNSERLENETNLNNSERLENDKNSKDSEYLEDSVSQYTYLTAQAGSSLGILAKTALDNSLTGLEFAHGIPGTVGGAVFMNAGAYDGEIKDVFYSCRCIDENGMEKTLYSKDMDFSYRYSILQSKKLILVSATFRLKKGNKDEIKGLMDDLMERRRSKQPLEYPSVGSFFKRPKGYFAAKLIEDSGLKGFSFGGAQVSEKHSGFVINKGNATTKDILSLADTVEKTVFEKFGVHLEKEARIIDKN